jgi:DNA sulfur modification protein DndC
MSTHQHVEAQLKLFDQGSEAKAAGSPPARRRSAFDALGFRKTIARLQEEVRALYTADQVPWIVGYSGGKDSTATLPLIWTAIASLPAGQRRKPVHVISTDTLVENPIVSAWVSNSINVHEAVRQGARHAV